MAWQKANYKRPKKANRIYRKHAVPINSMISQTLKRHGIGAQVQAAMIVREGNRILDQIVETDFRSDLRVLSYVHKTLNVVCRHSAASHLANSLRSQLQESIEEQIPDAIIDRIYVRIDPHAVDHSADTLV